MMLMPDLTLEELRTNAETQKHVDILHNLLMDFAFEVLKRGASHDNSKFSEFELSGFTQYSPKLNGTTYGSSEYKQFLTELKPTLDHHYASNRHHPEFFENGIRDMTLVDIVEMLFDWWASTQRHTDGDIFRSIELNEKRFNIPPELSDIFRNTINSVILER
jgi:hypothetical protein